MKHGRKTERHHQNNERMCVHSDIITNWMKKTDVINHTSTHRTRLFKHKHTCKGERGGERERKGHLTCALKIAKKNQQKTQIQAHTHRYTAFSKDLLCHTFVQWNETVRNAEKKPYTNADHSYLKKHKRLAITKVSVLASDL